MSEIVPLIDFAACCGVDVVPAVPVSSRSTLPAFQEAIRLAMPSTGTSESGANSSHFGLAGACKLALLLPFAGTLLGVEVESSVQSISSLSNIGRNACCILNLNLLVVTVNYRHRSASLMPAFAFLPLLFPQLPLCPHVRESPGVGGGTVLLVASGPARTDSVPAIRGNPTPRIFLAHRSAIIPALCAWTANWRFDEGFTKTL